MRRALVCLSVARARRRRSRRLRVERRRGVRARHGQGTAADGAARVGGAVPGRAAGARLRRLVVHGDADRLDGRRSRSRTGRRSPGRSATRALQPSCAFGVLLFPNDDLDELERRNRDGTLPAIRHATTYAPALPLVLRPGKTWRGTISAPGALAGGLWVRLSFGPFVERRRIRRRAPRHRWCGSPITPTTSKRLRPSRREPP